MNSATVLAGTDRLTSMTFGERTRPATGAMSFRKLYGSDSYSVALMALEVGTSRTRWSDSHWLMIRATTSVAPPGGNGTIQCTGRVGYGSAARAPPDPACR